MKSPKIAILTLHPYNYGGVLSVMKAAYDFCSLYFDPTLFFLGFDGAISTSLRSLKFSSTALHKSYFGMKAVEIGSRYAFWEPGHYRFTLSTWKKYLEEYDYFFVVSGTPIAAHPLVLLNKKFILWAASTYSEDRAQRVKQMSYGRFAIDRLALNNTLKIEKKILEGASALLAMSSYTKKSFENIVPNKNIVVCGYPIEKKQYFDTNLNSEKFILAVGRFDDPRKNISMLLEVFEKLLQKIPDLKLYVVGNKPADLPSMSNLKNVIFTGYIDEARKNDLYKKASLMLITSFQEGLGISGLEALSHGVPVMSTDCGGPRDFVLDGKTGYLVKINDVDEMVGRSLKVLNDDDLRYEMKKEALLLIEGQYSTKHVFPTFEHALSSVYPEIATKFSNQAKIDESFSN